MKQFLDKNDVTALSAALSSPTVEKNSHQILYNFIDSYFEDTSISFWSFNLSKGCKFRWKVETFYPLGEPPVCLTQNQYAQLKVYLTDLGFKVSDAHREDDLQGGANYQAQRDDYIVLDCSKADLLQKIQSRISQPDLSISPKQ